ncbi:protein max isoform X2 [Eublepharis macularius]|uniref:Protein max isoform X2 n=1 Tax=Eublepharis macularius TaxID=481883 RepID=A0AA97IZG6_EUBMA|nr:protein max isoform X2 [Eublepharis macularius]
MTSRWRATLINVLITMRWSASVGTTSRTVSTACGILCHHFKERRANVCVLKRNEEMTCYSSVAGITTELSAEAQYKASRAQILDKATEYIQYMRRKNHTHQQDIDDLKRQNALLEQQVRALEKARSSAQLQANYSSSDNSLYTNPKGSTISAFDGGSDSSSESELEEPQSRKKLRMEAS